MNNFKVLDQIKLIYRNGGNIISFLKNLKHEKINSIEDILISYDFQAGSYIKGVKSNIKYNQEYCSEIYNNINKLGRCESLLEVGVGEATTLKTVISFFQNQPSKILGFDISWSRLKYAKAYLEFYKMKNVELFTANLFEIPLPDNCIDIVYTSHSLEPNGGREEEALKELYRIAKKYVILLEPSFELANEAARERMLAHGYVTNLVSTAKKLGYKIIKHELFGVSANPLNPTGIIIIEKNDLIVDNPISLVCPISKKTLFPFSNSLLYSTESPLSYPIIEGIPCLLKENSILTTHLTTDVSKEIQQ